MKRLLIAAAFTLLTTAAHAQAMNKPQACVGILTETNGEYSLEETSGGLWCGATIGQADARRVLKACRVGNLCAIRGKFSGRGVFYWTKITKVSNPEEGC